MQLRQAWRKVRWSLAHRGVGGTLRVALRGRRRHAPEAVHPFDERFGTDTGGLLGGGSLATGSRNDAYITAYAGVPPSRLRAALDRWEESLPPGEALPQFTLVDLGCGKARAMLLGSERSFGAVLGVELNPGLVAIAKQNVAVWKAGGHARTTLEVREGDATELLYPAGSLLVFIYNSFGVPVVRGVLDALAKHVAATGCRVDLIFQNEGPEMPLRSDARLEVLWRGLLPLQGEEAEAEPVASPEDVTALYRWVG